MPATPVPLPCGTWPSPLSPEQVAAGAVALGHAEAAAGRMYWTEGRPAERGRSALLCRMPDGSISEPLGADPDTANVRSRVHEYGGSPYLPLAADLVFAHFDDQRLRRVDADGKTTVLTPPGCRYADFSAAPDSASVVAVREDHRRPGEPANAVVRVRLDGADDAGQVLYDGSDFVAWPRISADGQHLAWVAWDHPAMPWDATRLMVAELSTDGLQRVHSVAGGLAESVAEPQWANDGSLYFLSDRSGWWNLYRWQGGSITAVTSLTAEIGGPLWNLGMRSYLLLGDGRALLRVSQGGRDSLHLLDLSDGSPRALALPFVNFGSLGMLNARTALTVAAAEDDVPVLIALDLHSGTHSVVRRSGDTPLAADAVSRPQAIAFATAPGQDGSPRQAHAWFYAPRHPQHGVPDGERPPLIALLHGGPTSCASAALKLAVQFWTTRGFAVVDVNYGGSSGFGRPYRQRLNGQWGVVDLQDAIAAVDHVVAAGLVDGARVALRGGSAGGFTVLCGLAFSQRFAAGINYFGVADLESLAADTHKFESRYLDGLVAPLPEGRAIYQARSPVHHMGNCRSALITFQGSDDKAVPPQQSRDVTAAARAAGCPVAYIEFAGEGHGFRQGPNIVRALQAELVFLGKVFGFVPAGELPPLAIDNLRTT